MKLNRIMKYLFSILISIIFLASCSRDIPEDIHDHEEPNKIRLTYSEVGSNTTKIAEYSVGTGASAPLVLEEGKVYDVDVSFYYNSEDLTYIIEDEADEHFMKYQFANDISISIERTDEDVTRTDGQKLGLKMLWTINSSPTESSAVNVQLIHDADSVDDAANSGGGSNVLGEPDVNANFLIEK